MPFENPQAASAPTRRSSRPRIAASEASAAGATATTSEDINTVSVATSTATEASGVVPEAPLSRRAARQRLSTAEIFVAAATADSATDAVVPADETETAVADVPAHSEPAIVSLDVDSESAPQASRPAESASASAPFPSTEEDAFEIAARAFRSVATASTPVAEQPKASTDSAAPEASTPHVAVGRRTPRRFLAIGATVGVMSLAGLLAVGMTLPAEAVAAVQGGQSLASTSLVAASGSASKASSDDEIQAFVTSSDVQNESLARSDSFSTVSLVQVASEEGINYSNELFTNDTEAAIQWPFKVGVGMSSGYGMRWGRLHEGIDFVPGEGAPIQAIADGVVRIATEQGNAYGVTVYIDHVIDGQVITSHYSHMQYGSLQVKAGQTVKVGDIVGHTGNTGRSYGAHLHFELIVNGSTIDPLPWLRENAGRYSY
ncbi:peptidoglycan DD-metalloendopeptidase family protein [Microbacterium sp. C5A9]|uniref:M23 family metallopeptidase n=1 Tax=Microbacterium sp. C5A9 TaxID=2736663 RepID=UPI001F5249FC|nr:M23 family metallopeptidase [Microbacterium sp. C5A9]MCI1017414.1 peptidoglycan DD-metalloendopeptidase family protein [Microbacterium sp. C5A9]